MHRNPSQPWTRGPSRPTTPALRAQGPLATGDSTSDVFSPTYPRTRAMAPNPLPTLRTPQRRQEGEPPPRTPRPHQPSSPLSKFTPRHRATQPLSLVACLHNLRTQLQTAYGKFNTGKPRKTLPADAIAIAKSDWETIVALADQTLKLNQQDTRLFDTVASIATNLTSLQATFEARISSVEAHIQDCLPTPPSPTTYAQILKSGNPQNPLAPTTEPESRIPRPGRNPELELTLVQTDPKQPVFTTTLFPELKSKIERILTEAGIENQVGQPIAIRTISRHPSKDLIIMLHSKEDANKLRSTAQRWVPQLSPLLSLRTTLYPVICHRIPTDFDPTTPEAIAELKASAAGQLDSLVKAVWACPKKVHPEHGPSKTTSSIIIYTADPVQANNIIRNGLPFRATQHAAEKSRRSLIQCHNCQRFGHTAVRCSSPPACSRCAAHHVTTACTCPETPPCPDHRTCTHVTLQCALCGQEHRASFRDCPSRLNAINKLRELGHHDDEFYPITTTYA